MQTFFAMLTAILLSTALVLAGWFYFSSKSELDARAEARAMNGLPIQEPGFAHKYNFEKR